MIESSAMMMRTLMTLTVLAAASLTLAAETVSKNAQEVLAAQQSLMDATVKRDFATIDKLMADDLSYTHSTGTIENKQQFKDAITKNRNNYQKIETLKTDVREYGKTVCVLARQDMHGKNADGSVNLSKLFILYVWTKDAGQWKLHLRQASRLP